MVKRFLRGYASAAKHYLYAATTLYSLQREIAFQDQLCNIGMKFFLLTDNKCISIVKIQGVGDTTKSIFDYFQDLPYHVIFKGTS